MNNTRKIIDTLLDYHSQYIQALNMNESHVGTEFKQNVIKKSKQTLDNMIERLVCLIDMHNDSYGSSISMKYGT